VSLRFFSDQCVPREIVARLRDLGHGVLLLRQHLPIRAPDPEVIAKAQELDCLLLSLNGDFADIVTYPPGRYRGIVAIQLHDHPEIIPALMTERGRFFAAHPDPSYYHGKLFLVEVHRIRIRS
jgi:predicted nuclease of predicted toxin-antitoxin system